MPLAVGKVHVIVDEGIMEVSASSISATLLYREDSVLRS